MNEYYTFTEDAVAFTTADDRPYNREFKRVQHGFDKLPDPKLLDTGTQYFANMTKFMVGDVQTQGIYVASFPRWPGSATVPYAPTPLGVRLFVTFPEDVPVLGFGVVLSINIDGDGQVQGTTGSAAIDMRDVNGLPYPEGTFLAGAIYEIVISDNSLGFGAVTGQILSGGAAILSAAERGLAATVVSRNAAASSASQAAASLVTANTSYNGVLSVQTNVNSRYQVYANYQASTAFQGLVFIDQAYPPVTQPVPHVFSRFAANQLYLATAGKANSVHTHAATDIVPSAGTTAVAGFVQLNDTLSSTSLTQAATARAMAAVNTALAGKAALVHTHSAADIVPSAGTTAVAGFVQLIDSFSSTSTTLAATPNAVKQVYDGLAGKANTVHSHNWTDITTGVPSASTTQAGIVQLANNLITASTTQALTAVQGNIIRSAVNAKANTVHNHTWADIVSGVPSASTTQAGMTILLNSSAGGGIVDRTVTANALNSLRVLIANAAATSITRRANPNALLVGSMVMASMANWTGTAGIYGSGSSFNASPASPLRVSNCNADLSTSITSGTWRCMGAVFVPAATAAGVSIFVRTA